MRTYYLGFTYHNKRMLFGRLDVPGREQLEAIVRSLRLAFAGCHLANLRTLPIEAIDPATLDADEQYRLHCEWDDQERLIGVLARDPRLCDERLHVLMEAVAILARDQRVRAADGASSSTAPEATRPDIDPATHAMAIIFQEPEITPTELARRVGVSRGTLYGGGKWSAVARTLRSRDPSRIPGGSKSADGDIEAWDRPDDG